MTEHSTLVRTALVRTVSHRKATPVVVHAGGPSGDAAAAATFVDLVCADHELVAAEFDAIITANFPEAAAGPRSHDRSVRALTGTDLIAPWAAHAWSSWRPPGGAGRIPQHLCPRERGPPGTRAAAAPRIVEPTRRALGFTDPATADRR